MKLRAVILTVFLFLIAISSAVIITFTYSRNISSIRKFSQGTINRVSALIVERIDCHLRDLQRMPEMAVGFFSRHSEISRGNEELIRYFLEGVKFHPNLYAFYVGDAKGRALVVFNLSITDKPFTLSDPSKLAPTGTMYAMMLVDPSVQPYATWTYFDKDLKVILEEKATTKIYDPRIRPWYIGAEKAGKLFWTDVFLYDPTGDHGIAVAMPVYDSDGVLTAVIAADLSFNLFSHFITEQAIGKEGKAFILDGKGTILLPISVENLQEERVEAAYRRFGKTKEADFTFSFEKEKYLVSVHPFAATFEKNWLIMIVDPLSDYFSEILETQRQVVLISLLILFLASLLIVYVSKRISDPISALSKEIDKITLLDLESERKVKSKISEISKMESSIAALKAAIRSFSRYVPKEVVKKLLLIEHEIIPGGEKEELTVLFTDITEFTPLAESLPIEMLNTLLTEYFDILSKIIMKHQGTIDKYIGDGIMAFWGAPQKIADHAAQSCFAALECQAALAALNQARKEKNEPEFLTRIGINTGPVIVGNFGTLERMNYTAIGDVVNTAARLQGIDKIYHTKILIGEEVVKQIDSLFLVRPIDDVEVKGKKKKIKIYELVNRKTQAKPEEIELCELFTRAFDAFHKGDLSTALQLFKTLQSKFPSDYPSQIYLQRLEQP